MDKPSGLFVYTVTALAGGGGSLTRNLLVDADDKGDLLDPDKLDPGFPGTDDITEYMAAWFVPAALVGTAHGGLVRTAVGQSVTDGVYTSIEAAVTNDNAGAGNTVSGRLYVLLKDKTNR